jgi:hypothetical protein
MPDENLIISFEEYCKEEWAEFRIPYERLYFNTAKNIVDSNLSDKAKIDKEYEKLENPKYICTISSEILDSLLSSVCIKKDCFNTSYEETQGKKDDYPKNNLDERYFYWQHRHDHMLEYDIRKNNIDIDNETLCNGVSNYLKNPNIHNEWLDWYCADVLIYNELINTLRTCRTFNNGIFSTLLIDYGGAIGKVAGYGLKLILFLIKWGVWLSALLFAINTEETIGYVFAIALFVTTLLVQGLKFHRKQKIGKLLASMIKTYATLKSNTFSWSILWEEMNDSRKLGAIWSGELWKLVEMKKDKN